MPGCLARGLQASEGQRMKIWIPGDPQPPVSRPSGGESKHSPGGIDLATRENNHIENYQCRERLQLPHRKEDKALEERYKAERRTGPTAGYNCHGLTFACRRAEINDPALIWMIIKDDLYQQIPRTDVLPGDLILYFDPDDGHVEHSGIVISVNGQDKPPMVVSKWGKYGEFIHRADYCPYNYFGSRYYRVDHDKFGVA
jgi:hypothetical protein